MKSTIYWYNIFLIAIIMPKNHFYDCVYCIKSNLYANILYNYLDILKYLVYNMV
jgi:hypothetical protein